MNEIEQVPVYNRNGGYVYPKIEMGKVGDDAILTMVKQGITRREDLAKAAMQGMLSNCPDDTERAVQAYNAIPELSYKMADAMIAEGNK